MDWPKIVALRRAGTLRAMRNARVTSGVVISTRTVACGWTSGSARSEAVELDDFLDAAFEAGRIEAVNAAVELQIFCDGEVEIQAEILRHVADALAHFFGVLAHVQPFDSRGAAA